MCCTGDLKLKPKESPNAGKGISFDLLCGIGVITMQVIKLVAVSSACTGKRAGVNST
jgi:hypothetical protein